MIFLVGQIPLQEKNLKSRYNGLGKTVRSHEPFHNHILYVSISVQRFCSNTGEQKCIWDRYYKIVRKLNSQVF